MIKLTNINKYYFKKRRNEIHVLNNINLELPQTSLVTILGASGSGKSTLLNVIGGLDKASGNISYFNELQMDRYNPSKLDPYRNDHIGYIFQNYNLIDDLTVYENLVFALELLGIKDKNEIDAKIDKALDLVNMRRFKRRTASLLSGGQQQRIAIARAIVKGCKVIIADEPTGNLDSRNTIDVMNLLKSLSSECLVLLVTHDKDIAYKYSDRIISLKDGCITSDENYNNTELFGYNDIFFKSDYEKLEVKQEENIKLNVYSNKDIDLDINLYVVDNVIHIDLKSSLQTKVLGVNSNLEVLDHKEENEVKDKIDSSYFKRSEKAEKTNLFLYFLTRLKKSFIELFQIKRKTGFLYFIFFVMGMLICYNIQAVNNGKYVDVEARLESVDTQKILVNSTLVDKDFMWDDELKDVFIDLGDYYKYNRQLHIEIPIIYNRCIDVYTDASSINHYTDISYDKELLENEVILSKYLAKNILTNVNKYKNYTQKDLIDHDILIQNKYYKVVDIEENLKNDTIIFNEISYLTLCDYIYDTDSRDVYFEGKITFKRYIDASDYGVTLPVSDKIDDKKINVYTSNSDYLQYGSDYFINYISYESDNLELKNICFFASDEDYVRYLEFENIAEIFYRSDYTLVSGESPKYKNEVIIDEIFKGTTYETNIKKEYIVTGYYKHDKDILSVPICSFKMYVTYQNFRYDPDLDRDLQMHTNDEEKVYKYFESLGEDVHYYDDYYINIFKEIKEEQMQSSIRLIVGMLAIIAIFIIFIGRSKMISKIKTIGIYRALGLSKVSICISFIAEGIIIATFSSAIGYILYNLIVINLANKMSFLKGYVLTPYNFMIGILAIYVTIVIAITLPVFLLLRKTPIEIITKYDI